MDKLTGMKGAGCAGQGQRLDLLHDEIYPVCKKTSRSAGDPADGDHWRRPQRP